jgi:AraC-like DNA-binding protein
MRLAKWIKFIKTNINFYRDGFFELPYLSNSPQVMLKSIINSPSARHVASEQAVYRNNPFSKGVMRYREIEDGFWIISTSITFRKNVMLKAIYDEDVPSDYHTLTFSVFESQVKLQNTFQDKVPFSSNYWGFKKPGTEVGAYFYKDSVCNFYLYSFNDEWIKKNLAFETLSDDNQIKNFLDSKNGFITYQDIVPNAAALSMKVWHNLERAKFDPKSQALLKSQTLSLVASFFNNAYNNKRKTAEKPLETPEYQKIAKAEKLIMDNLTTSFLGVEAIAEAVNMSPTKLKSSFKAVYGSSLLQYHISKNMILAMQLIQNTDMQIKTITYEMGYESPSKFAATFKKQFGKLPSEVRTATAVQSMN